MAGKKDSETELTPKQELFCQAYVSEDFFCNGVKAYMLAFGKDEDKYNSAKVEASKLLTNPNVLKRIDDLIGDLALNDQFVDKQLAKMILQEEDKKVKVQAIKEYNNLRARITKNINVGMDEKLEKALGTLSNIIDE